MNNILTKVKFGYQRVWKSAGPLTNWPRNIGWHKRTAIGALKALDLLVTPFRPEGTYLERLRIDILGEQPLPALESPKHADKLIAGKTVIYVGKSKLLECKLKNKNMEIDPYYKTIYGFPVGNTYVRSPKRPIRVFSDTLTDNRVLLIAPEGLTIEISMTMDSQGIVQIKAPDWVLSQPRSEVDNYLRMLANYVRDKLAISPNTGKLTADGKEYNILVGHNVCFDKQAVQEYFEKNGFVLLFDKPTKSHYLYIADIYDEYMQACVIKRIGRKIAEELFSTVNNFAFRALYADQIDYERMYVQNEVRFECNGIVFIGKIGNKAQSRRNEKGEYEVTFLLSDVLKRFCFLYGDTYIKLFKDHFPGLVEDEDTLIDIVNTLGRGLTPIRGDKLPFQQGLYATNLHDIIHEGPDMIGGYIFYYRDSPLNLTGKVCDEGNTKLMIIDKRHVAEAPIEILNYGYHVALPSARPHEINPAVITFVEQRKPR